MITHRFDQPGSHQVLSLKEAGEHRVEIAAEGISLVIIGQFQTQDADIKSVKLIIRHQARNTQSRTYLRGVVNDQSQLVLSGTIVVESVAKNTNAFLDERILLLSPQAKADAVPNLEIYNNDVKCSHAAAISSIPENQLFYLMSRGLDKTTATKLIVDGFLSTNPAWLK